MFRKWMTVVLASLTLCMTACAPSREESASPEKMTDTPLTYEQITQEQAKALMDSETDYVILDTRAEDEFATGHIAGAVCIAHDEILQKAESRLLDKNQLILVYCRSGRRSKLAAEDLVSLGYTNVKEFGGIIDWTYGTVTE